MAGLSIRDNELLEWDSSKTSMQVKLGELVQYFQMGIPKNDNFPRAYVDPTQIMPHLLEVNSPDDLADDVIEMAKIAIDFEDGLPTVDGIPFWERLEGEPIPYYKMYKEYREMKYLTTGTETFSRSIAKLAETSGMSGKQLNALARVYHWQIRVKAYDRYKEIEKQLCKQNAVEHLESKHAKISNDLLDQAVLYLTTHPEQLNPKVAIDLAKLAMDAGRLSLGLNPDKPGSSEGSASNGGARINIVNQNTSVGDNSSMEQVNMVDGLSDVERKTKENSQDVTHLQSILHVLNASGAFATAAGQTDKDCPTENENYTDADVIEETND